MFPAGAHDDQVDAAADALRELVGTAGNTGMIDFYGRLAREQVAAAPLRDFHFGAQALESGLVALVVPEGLSTAYGLSGRCYTVDRDRLIAVEPDDVGPFRAAGFLEPINKPAC